MINQRDLICKTLVFGILVLLICTSTVPTIGADLATTTTLDNNGSLLGIVNDTSGNPIEGALIRVNFHETYEEDYSDSTGYYHVTNIPICYCLKNATCSKEGYKTEWVLLGIAENTTHDFVLTSGNNPPEAPTIDGPNRGMPNQKYTFTFNSEDPDDDDVKYYIDWGDGYNFTTNYATSGSDVSISHKWDKFKKYTIFAKAEDIYGAESNWSEHEITIPRTRATFNSLFHWFLERFPMLEKLLTLLR